MAASAPLADWRQRAGCKMPPTRIEAIRLHEWNVVLCAAAILPLQIIEITLRNRMHSELSAYYGNDFWWDEPPTAPGQTIKLTRLVHEQATAVNDAKNKIRTLKPNKPVTAGRIISELPFGFWVALIGSNYDNPSGGIAHWRNCLHKVFKQSGNYSRKDVHSELNNLRQLRNAVAHHDPIVTRNLSADFALIVSAIGKIDTDAQSWVKEASVLPHLVRADWLKALKAAGGLIGAS